MQKESNVFLVDHAWTTDWSHARGNLELCTPLISEQLKMIPNLLDRMYKLMDLDTQDQENSEETTKDSKAEEVSDVYVCNL